MDVAPTGTGTDDGADPVTRALHRLDTVAALPLEQRPDAFQDIHEHLRSALAEIDDA